jgi:hypothetical protein
MVSRDVRRHRLISISYMSLLPCHGRGYGFESPRPRQFFMVERLANPLPFRCFRTSANRAIPRRRRRNTLPRTPRPEYSRHRDNFFIASSQPSSRLRDQNLGELRNPHGSDCWVRYGSNNFGQNGGANDDKGKDCNYLGPGDYSPEKAGVGGSTPSLATTFSTPPIPPQPDGSRQVSILPGAITAVLTIVVITSNIKA